MLTPEQHRELDSFVSRNIIGCFSSIIYDVIQHPSEASTVFDIDVEDIYGWSTIPDWAEARAACLRDLDLSELLDEADEFGYRSDAIDATDAAGHKAAMEASLKAFIKTSDDPEDAEYDHKRICDMDLEEWMNDEATKEQVKEYEADIRIYVEQRITSDDETRELFNRHNVDLSEYEREVYEHWAVDRWFAARLAELGELIFDFGGYQIWGRTCTGQSISMDENIQQIFLETQKHENP